MPDALLEIRDVTKIYKDGNVKALDGVSLDIYSGRINVLLGENAAGKSTLMKIIAGIESCDKGSMVLAGREYLPDKPAYAFARGVALVSQSLKVITQMTVLENLLLALHNRAGNFSWRKKRETVRNAMKEYNLQLDLGIKVSNLSVGEKQKLEILRALLAEPELIIFDEPTAVFSDREREELFDIMERLKAEGKTIIFITHKFAQAYRIADTISLMRKGKIIDTFSKETFVQRNNYGSFIGEAPVASTRTDCSTKREVLRVESLEVAGKYRDSLAVRDLSFGIKTGELTVITGITGNGQEELLEALFGLREVKSGKVLLGGKDITNKPPKTLRRAGLAALPVERDSVASCRELSILENMIINTIREGPLLYDRGALAEWTEKALAEYGVIYASLNEPAGNLSGGNLQKALVAREVKSEPTALLLGEPTRGLDVRHTRIVHDILRSLKERMAVVVFTSDLDEALLLGDRVIIMVEGVAMFSGEVGPWLDRRRLGELVVGSVGAVSR